MKTTHTPGPWINDGDSVSALVDPENSATYIAPICDIDNGWAEETQQANAALIAAAPELLQALESLHDATKHYFRDFEHLHPSIAGPLSVANAAILTARGEA
jgi:hypothetical protein